jgi:uncharacterized membrane protein
MRLVGHLVWSLPFLWLFGVSLETLHAGQAALGLVLSYLVLRRFLSTGLALLGTALVAVFPGYTLLATSYMTDTTAFAAQTGCLLLGLVALERPGRARGLLLLSLGVGLYGYTIREPALAAPLSVAVATYLALTVAFLVLRADLGALRPLSSTTAICGASRSQSSCCFRRARTCLAEPASRPRRSASSRSP